MQKLLFFLVLVLAFSACRTKDGTGHTSNQDHKYTNELINESSPYLLQHAHNPVNWHPWNDATLAKAKAEKKMLLISVGYAACHWCHVMEHESFEDTLVARIMNENFIPIKVDREERPDVDDVYMTACHMSSKRSCGWPLNAFALPDGRPVFAGTYYPKKEWIDVLQYFIKSYTEEPAEMEKYAQSLTEGIKNQEAIIFNDSDKDFNKPNLESIADNFLNNVDFELGGRKGAPKFPMPTNWDFLLRYNHFTGDEQALEAVNTTLTEMANGGIYDHLGGGFARYSTDAMWKAPHFEKMLYDNGQLVSLYSEAFKMTKNPLYETRVHETLEFIARELTDKNGGFYSSLDADTEGEEGKFYVWHQEEIDSLLGVKNAATFSDYYEVKKGGNWEEHKNILHRKMPAKKVAKKNNMTEEDLAKVISESKKILFAERAKRVRPGLDDKVLTSWNALMMKGYADAFAAFGNEEYKAAAVKNGEFILKEVMQKDGRLNRNYKDGKSVINAFSDDYALTIQGFVSLYQITFDTKWLDNADKLAQYTIAHFQNKESKMFFYTSDEDADLIARKSEIADNVIPGSNSSMARALFSLGTYIYKPAYLEIAKQMMHNVQDQIIGSPQPNFYSNWCNLYLDLVRPPYEVAIMGKDYAAKRNELLKSYLPNALLLGGDKEGNMELLQDKLQEGETMIYVCQNKVCKLPVTDVEKALGLIK